MADRREEILLSELGSGHSLFASENKSEKQEILNAMDEYMKECVLLAFEFVAHETNGHSLNETTGELEFKYKGDWINREQLFENFL